MATRLDKANRDLEALNALSNNGAFKKVHESLLKDQDGTIASLASQGIDPHDRSWLAGYLVGLSTMGGKLEKLQTDAEKIVNEDREKNGG